MGLTLVGSTLTGATLGGVTAFAPDAVTFDGTNDVLHCADTLANFDSKVGIISAFVNRLGDTGTSVILSTYNSGSDGMVELRFGGDNTITAQCRKDTGNASFIILTSTQTITDSNWHHIAVCYDTTSSTNTRMFIDDVEETLTLKTVTDDFISWDASHMTIGARFGDGLKFSGDLAEVIATDEFLDFNTVSNRRKVINADGTPADPGADGSAITGTQPRVYQTGDAAAWNAGTHAGSFTTWSMTGAVTDSSNEPVDAI